MLLVCCFGYLGCQAALDGLNHTGQSLLFSRETAHAKAFPGIGFRVLHLYVAGFGLKEIQNQRDFLYLPAERNLVEHLCQLL